MPELKPESTKTVAANAASGAESSTVSRPQPGDAFLYRDDLDYLDDIRLLLYEGGKARSVPYPLPEENQEFRIHWEQIREKRVISRRLGSVLRIDNLVIDFDLDELQELILCSLAVDKLIGNRGHADIDEFLKIISGDDLRTVITARNALKDLKKKKLVLSRQHSPENEVVVDADVLSYLSEGKSIKADKFRDESKTAPKPAEFISELAAKFAAPQAIRQALDRYVIGQDEVKTTLSVAAFTHLQRIQRPESRGEGVKPNVMLIGPTGCGKTHLVKTLASILGLPYAIGDATTWTEAGYVGSDYDEVLWALFENAGHDIEFAQRGIVFIDEVDKLAAKATTAPRDVGGGGVQRALLKPLEGATVTMAKRGEHSFIAHQKSIDTRDIFFILGGAFDGIGELVESRTCSRKIGFETEKAGGNSMGITTEDLVAYGMLREFVGRIPIIAGIKSLGRDELMEILTRPEQGLIAEINRTYEPCGLRFQFSNEAIQGIAEKALREGTGARSLRGLVSSRIETHVYKHSHANPSGIRVVEIAA